MSLTLPRLSSIFAITETKTGKALPGFTRFWDKAMSQIESQFSLPGTNGIVVTDGSSVGLARTLTPGTGIGITNGDGVAGNPTIALADTAVTPASYGAADHVAEITVDQQGRITAASAVAISITKAAAGLSNVANIDLSNVVNKAQVPLDGSDGMTGPLTVKSYTVAMLPSTGPGHIAFASDGRKAGEGPGAGTGVLVFGDGTNWIAVDSGSPVAA